MTDTVDRERHRRAKEIFLAAREKPREQRHAFVDAACDGDAQLGSEVTSLLALQEETAAGDGQSGDRPPSSIEEETTGIVPTGAEGIERIGPYRILRQVGEGGMGVVFEAEQEEPVRRRVALKLVKWGMDTRQVIARFESERQALALMSHPNIARVLDAGATVEGRPYFAMEYVKGEPITRYCDRHRLTIRRRLELFESVCSGLQHAHQKGIVHRDVKPSNVLVQIEDGEPVPKVIDFGVAKAIDHRLTTKTVFTEYGQMIGTPEYMSPEQAEMTGLDIDTRTDVYALGVLLYELLVGALPFDSQELRRAGFDEVRRRIREEEPVKPSTKVSSAKERSTATRRTDRSSLVRELRGDLDCIIMKALDKDRTRRYASASDLSADIRRYLDHEPVKASRPSTTYRARKFVQRHRIGVAAASVVVLAVVLGLVTASYGLLRALRAEAEARREAAAAEHVSDFLVDLFSVSGPNRARGNKITAREILDRGAREIDETLADQPEVQARLMATMAEVYSKLGLYEQARPLAERALETRRRLFGDDHALTMGSINDMAIVLRALGKLDEAETYSRELLERTRRVLGEDDPRTLTAVNNLGFGLKVQGKLDEAEPYYRMALDRRRRVLGDHHRQTLLSLHNMGGLLYDLGKLDEAEPLLRQALAMRRRLLGDDHTDTFDSLHLLGRVLRAQGRPSEAEPLFREAQAGLRHVLGEQHPRTLISYRSLGSVYRALGRYDEAEPLLAEALAGLRRVLGDDDEDTLSAQYDLACVLAVRGELRRALELLRQAVELGWAGPELGSDSDLDALRRQAEFEALVVEVERRVSQE